MDEKNYDHSPDVAAPNLGSTIDEQEIKRLANARLRRGVDTPEKYATKSDTDLVTDYLNGDQQAFSEIITRHHRTLYWVARRYAERSADAEDIFQEALLRASKNLAHYRGECRLLTWLYRLVANAAYDYLHHGYGQEVFGVDDPDFQHKYAKLFSYNPIERHADTMTLSTAVNALTAEQREAILLIDYQGYNVDQVAKMQQTKPGTVKSRRARARNQLRDMLEQKAS